ncbi:ComEC family protein [Cronobacter muytjensii]|uniref:ComEC family protein n=1 Tax=Cronobacter muytjensii TaxID=413501 RepID=A0A2T7AMJ6_9ENTR|nr:ComEC family protein [Cronobacter muytjensii]KAB0874807.1 ComEC family protein [Cronobacter muytjensii]MBF4810255.1 ComEC family protein [Cronobacter muytjensii]PUX10265.1 ComEC family protein [Cronobacter muytjensii]
MIPLPALCLCVMAGLSPLLFLPALPPVTQITALTLLASVMVFLRYRAVCYPALMLLFLCWGLFAARQATLPYTSLAGKTHQAEVVVTDTDGATEHNVKILRLNGERWLSAPGAILRGTYLPQQVCAGQRWLMTLRLRPVHGQLNEGGFDRQRYALSQHQPLNGRVVAAQRLSEACSFRSRYIASVSQQLAPFTWRPVILALGFGERVALTDDVKTLLRETGTAHLMAISGLHIGFVGTLGWALARLLQLLLPARWIGYRFPLMAMLATAALYTWLSGSNPPAVRTLVAISVWCALRFCGRQWTPWQVWACCVGSILFCDPVAILSESLWLSAFAVAALIFWYQWVPLRADGRWRHLKSLLHLQCGMTLLLLPLQLLLFHGISLSSLLANLVAVPAVTFIAVPLVLAGMLLDLAHLTWAEQGIWLIADRTLAALFWFLRQLPPGWLGLDQRYQWLMLAPWAGVILWRTRWWRTSAATCGITLGLLSWPFWQKPAEDTWRLHMLDIGHGLSVVIERHGKAILYDSGNAWAGGDSAQQTIIPWLRWHHLEPEGIVISHEHLDHRGGLESLARAWPQMWIRSPLGWANHFPCVKGVHWRWQGLDFTVHWPPEGFQARGNNRSCVVKIDDGEHSVLLTGDIEAPAELAMLKKQWRQLQADIIQVPHHGSRTSSTPTLLSVVNGKAALASVSRYNAWRLPSTTIIRRYKTHRYQWCDTAHAGQISVSFSPGQWQIEGFREQILPRWYHQWFGSPAEYR